jgi:hypothetical protein
MSTVEHRTAAAWHRIAATPRPWQRFARALRRFDEDERYSPVICVATLLIVGVIVKLIPAIQAHSFT